MYKKNQTTLLYDKCAHTKKDSTKKSTMSYGSYANPIATPSFYSAAATYLPPTEENQIDVLWNQILDQHANDSPEQIATFLQQYSNWLDRPQRVKTFFNTLFPNETSKAQLVFNVLGPATPQLVANQVELPTNQPSRYKPRPTLTRSFSTQMPR